MQRGYATQKEKSQHYINRYASKYLPAGNTNLSNQSETKAAFHKKYAEKYAKRTGKLLLNLKSDV